jgi:hypothetical protein
LRAALRSAPISVAALRRRRLRRGTTARVTIKKFSKTRSIPHERVHLCRADEVVLGQTARD